ncbi:MULTISPECIES: hypothetical protein [Rhodomicrobium]|uniref:hypothetical protein n=1 Tax=Rhodomicrobium TaxID=1068 RepID=UPI000B4B065A|nr:MULTISPECIES: hypothetical protein [Rhodomicrobium]
MFSGLERERAALRRQRSVAWAWIKARGIINNRPTPSHAKLTTSVLLTSDCSSGEETANWRDSLAAITHRDLARQVCDQFYDLSILYAWQSRSAQAIAERSASPALPSYCTAQAKDAGPPRVDKARILKAILADQPERRSAVLLSIKSKAA